MNVAAIIVIIVIQWWQFTIQLAIMLK